MELITLGTGHGKAEAGRACSASLLTVGTARYLIDCGCDAEARLRNLGIDYSEIRAVFVTHMHVDHAGFLSSMVKCFNIPKEGRRDIYLPEEEGVLGLNAWIKALHQRNDEEKCRFLVTRPGEIYQDETISVTAIANDHMQKEGGLSYSYLVKAEGKTILFTGDLSADLHDYPAILQEESVDVAICELTHFKIWEHFEFLSKTKTKQMIFNHVHPRNIEAANELLDKFPFPAIVAEEQGRYEL